ncbi:MAG: hypothetical protein IPG67_06095 [Acidobacteria bacterium]|nr:hypothetical protein [Acidobacteriota bacterium]
MPVFGNHFELIQTQHVAGRWFEAHGQLSVVGGHPTHGYAGSGSGKPDLISIVVADRVVPDDEFRIIGLNPGWAVALSDLICDILVL